MEKKVTVVSVAFNSFEVLPEMAESLPRYASLSIVDNGADDGLRDWAEAQGHRIIVPGKNLGFGSACNLGAKDAETPYLLFLNPDARIEKGALDVLLAAAGSAPLAVAFGPQFIQHKNDVYKVRPSKVLKRSIFAPRWTQPTEPTEVPSLNGAAMLVRRDSFEKINGFDDEIFLYFEDDDISLRLAKECGPLLYIPEAKFFHAIGGSSVSSTQLVELKAYHYAQSYIYTMKKHGRQFSRTRGLLRALRRWVSVRNVYSAERRADARGCWRGTMFMLHK